MQITSLSSPATGQQAGGQTKADLEKAAKAFEAIFMRQMIGAMRSASLDEGLGDSSATGQFRDMADARTADAMADSGHGFGIAALLLKQFEGRLPASAAGATGAAAATGTGDSAT
ncbi:MAG: flagellar biosynthesis protein FlgI [Sphingobium sp.]|nr:MAG: flagellar biosynthesis protein FlgI [Sphingobium sp.]